MEMLKKAYGPGFLKTNTLKICAVCVVIWGCAICITLGICRNAEILWVPSERWLAVCLSPGAPEAVRLYGLPQMSYLLGLYYLAPAAVRRTY